MTFVSSPRKAQLIIELHNPLQDLNGMPLAHQTNRTNQVDAELVVEMFTERKQLRAGANREEVSTVHEQVSLLTPEHHGRDPAVVEAVLKNILPLQVSEGFSSRSSCDGCAMGRDLFPASRESVLGWWRGRRPEGHRAVPDSGAFIVSTFQRDRRRNFADQQAGHRSRRCVLDDVVSLLAVAIRLLLTPAFRSRPATSLTCFLSLTSPGPIGNGSLDLSVHMTPTAQTCPATMLTSSLSVILFALTPSFTAHVLHVVFRGFGQLCAFLHWSVQLRGLGG